MNYSVGMVNKVAVVADDATIRVNLRSLVDVVRVRRYSPVEIRDIVDVVDDDTGRSHEPRNVVDVSVYDWRS